MFQQNKPVHEHKPVEQQLPQPTVRPDYAPAHSVDVSGFETLEVPYGFTIAGLLARVEALEVKAGIKPDAVNETEAEVDADEAAEAAKKKAAAPSVKAEDAPPASKFTTRPTPKA